MGKIGKCCCQVECCAPVEVWDEIAGLTPEPFSVKVPDDWDGFGDCCKTLEVVYDSPQWRYVCSDPTHVETIYAEVDWALKLHPRLFWTAPTGTTVDDVACGTNKSGETTCSIDGQTIPLCDASGKFTCLTLKEVRQVTRSRILVVRWRPTKITLRVMRTTTQCEGDEEEKCKYIVFAFLDCDLEYLHAQKLSETHNIEMEDSACCRYSFVDGDNCSYSTGRQYCSDYTDLDFVSATVTDGLVLVRSKAFDTMPTTGTISFAPGDEITCDPIETLAFNCSGGNFGNEETIDSFQVNSSDTSFFAYAGFESGLTLNTNNAATVVCTTTVVFSDGSCQSYSRNVVDPVTTLDSSGWTSICCLTGAATSTYFLNEIPLQFVNFDGYESSCSSTNCGGTNANESHHLTATNLVKTRTTSGYTARSVVIDAGTWTIDLEP